MCPPCRRGFSETHSASGHKAQGEVSKPMEGALGPVFPSEGYLCLSDRMAVFLGHNSSVVEAQYLWCSQKVLNRVQVITLCPC
jgi:hypothetical protein